MEMIDQWKLQDALDIYEVRHWGKGYFGINDRAMSPSIPTSIPNSPST